MLAVYLLVQLALITLVQPASQQVRRRRWTPRSLRDDDVSYEDMMMDKNKNLHGDPRTEILLPNGCCGEHRKIRHLAVELTTWDESAMDDCSEEYVDRLLPTGIDPEEEWTVADIKGGQTGPETPKCQRMVLRAACINQCAAKRSGTALVTKDDKLDKKMISEAAKDMTVSPWQRKILEVALAQCTNITEVKELRTPQTGNLSCRDTAVTFQDCLSTAIDLNCPVEQRVKSPLCLKFWAKMNMKTDDKRAKTY